MTQPFPEDGATLTALRGRIPVDPRAGTNCTVAGLHGYVTGLRREQKWIVGAFVHVPPTVTGGSDGQMLYVTVGKCLAEGWYEATRSRSICRDEFDRLTEIDELRHSLGWRS